MAMIPDDGEWEGDDGEFEEERGLIIEQTSDFSGHYEIMALVREIAEIKELIQWSMEASRELQAEAQAVLVAHAESAQDYLRQVEEPVLPDFHPFQTMPENTMVRDLPDGGRLFSLADGSFVRVMAEGSMVAVSLAGEIVSLEPEGGQVTLPDGPVLNLLPEALRETHEDAMIEGLPLDVEPTKVAEGRYRVELRDGYRLDVDHDRRIASLSNPTGTTLILGLSRMEGIGEELEVRLMEDGGKGFIASTSGHKGFVEAGGSIYLAMANGQDLVISFPKQGAGDQQSSQQNKFHCEEPGQ